MKSFISEPVPRSAGVVQCYILRVKKGVTSLYPQYLLHMKDFDDKFLLAAKKRGQNKTSNYLICMDPENLDRSGENYVGKLRSNFWGTEFVFCKCAEFPLSFHYKVDHGVEASILLMCIFGTRTDDRGQNPKTVDPEFEPTLVKNVRKELGVALYASNVLGSRGPRKMRVAVPEVKRDGKIMTWQPRMFLLLLHVFKL